MTNICVFAASSPDLEQSYYDLARDVGACLAQEGMGIAVCPELFLRVIHVKSSQTTAEGLDLFPLSAASAVSRLPLAAAR